MTIEYFTFVAYKKGLQASFLLLHEIALTCKCWKIYATI